MFFGLNRNNKYKLIRHRLLALLSVIGLVMVSCGSEMPDVPAGEDNSDQHNASEEPCYFMSLNLSTPGSFSRADLEGDVIDSDPSGQLDQGFDNENTINQIRLFFFKGNYPVNVKANESSSRFSAYYDWFPETRSETLSQVKNSDLIDVASRAQNDGKSVNTTFPIIFEDNVKPDKVIAIVNPSAYIKSNIFSSFYKVKDMSEDFVSDLTDNNFLMSNSVYLVDEETSRKIVDYTEIKEENICRKPEEALEHPVTIYVERIAARLDFRFGNVADSDVQLRPVDGMNFTFDTGMTFSPTDSEESNKIYVKFLGWNITSTPRFSRLIKRIDSSWSDSDFVLNGGVWNQQNEYRSDWAINPETPEYEWLTYDAILPSEEGDGGLSMSVSRTYLTENANPFILADGIVAAANPTYPTKVIFAAQLLNEDGEPITIAEYQGNQLTLAGLKNVIANSLDMYYEEVDEINSTTELKKIQPWDITFETSREHGGEYGPEADGTFYSYACLNEESAKKVWYHKYDKPDNKDSYKIANPVKYIDDTVYEAKIWKEGRTYFYFDILHFDGTPENAGHYGVVRNHIYQAKIRGINSLGTPVYKPDEIIYPETPGKSGNMLTVTIDKLDWRLVKQHFQVSW